MNHSEIAVKKFREGYNCAQSVIYGFADKMNISKDLVLKLANGFGGGMGRKQEVCGAVSGGIMVIGLLYGRGENDDKEKQELTYSKVRELIDKFEARHGTVNCRKLLDGCDLLTPEGHQRFISENMRDKCNEYIEHVVKILEEITDDNDFLLH